ncbi:HTH-type transcriptional repressor CytR [Roseovarius albus]|uniref:HTH-type transcriptional repressor CytR n=1 Tax=Roseovarius albus TaxID=1247867 RepID=A0A1X7A420_9RHOB|nr:LacI family DNA-binding transcriptional regulator [Roseovarius albus]SLN69884.1 HTH-type transcriptional repressor CytR [Roseovarius albus]
MKLVTCVKVFIEKSGNLWISKKLANQKRKKRANLRDVAKAANVSVATVSRVLNSPVTVSEDTRRRVQDVIASLHFVPSAAARAINTGRTRVVGAIVPTLDNAIFSKFLATLEKTLAEHGLSLVVATTKGDPNIEAQKAQGLVDIGAEALIVSGVTHSPDFEKLIELTRLPVIATSCYDKNYHLPTIGYDNAGASRIALDFLLSAGHRKIAVVHGPVKDNDRTLARLSGLKALDQNHTLQTFETNISVQGGCDATQMLLAETTSFSVILCFSDVLALGVLFELQRNRIKVPDEMSLVGIDDLPSSSCTFPEITTVHLPVATMGETTGEAIVEWLDNHVAPKSKLLQAELIVRNSTREFN